tara:strand:+ start:1262 stop:2671 length:1410 start_codon:yes stop_codon:yes gene_type:complete
MAEPIDIGTLFADMLPDPMKAQRDEGARLSNLVSGGGSVAAYYAPQREATLRNALGGMFDVDTSTPAEKLREAMKGLDPNNPQDLIRLASMTDSIDPTKAMQLRQAAASMTKAGLQKVKDEERTVAERGAMSKFVNAAESINADTKIALGEAVLSGSYDGAFKDLIAATAFDKERYSTPSSGGVFDNYTGKFVEGTLEADGADSDNGILGTSKLNLKDWDRESYTKYVTEANAATTPEGKIDAQKWLRAVHPAGWKWTEVKDAEGNVVLNESGVPEVRGMPIGPDEIAITRDIDAANFAGEQAKEQIGNVLDTIDNVFEQLESGEVTTGFETSLVKYIPGSKPYTLAGDVDSILAMLGYQSLQDARKASANGSSGFGQLTQKELEDLRSLVSSLKVGMNEEDFVERLSKIKRSFERGGKRAKTDWNMESWRGIVQPSAEIMAEEDALQAGENVTSFTNENGENYTVELL